MGQFRNLANLPIAWRQVCGMPDYHLGYGMPIGGVLATQGGVVPYAVGVDIGCGMIACETDLEAERFSSDDLQKIRQDIHNLVPVGRNHHEEQQAMPMRLAEMAGGVVVTGQYERAVYQLGTLGGGNHFIELQRDPDGHLWVMLHSGSRNVGKQVCDHYHKIAKKYMQDFHSQVPDLDLSFLPESVPEYAAYLSEMRWCMAFAEESRVKMLEAVMTVLQANVGQTVDIYQQVDTHHNFAAMENHFNRNVLVHRKGAVKATGLVTIPGSMGTASYIAKGLTPVESFNTCSHGAGRAMGRRAANKMMAGHHEEAVKMMEHVAFNVRNGDYDELPYVIDEDGKKHPVYKDIDAVMAAQNDLVEPVVRLEPVAVVKG